MEDVLAVYERPYDPKRPVVCADESNKELHKTPRGTLPAEAGQVARQDYEYERNSTANMFMTVEPLVGKRRVRVTDRRTKQDFAELLRCLSDEDYSEADIIILVTDNLNTHSPEHGSWLNMAEIELSVLSRQCLARRISDKETLSAEVSAWETARNDVKVQIDWQFKTSDARIKLKRLYPVLIQQPSG